MTDPYAESPVPPPIPRQRRFPVLANVLRAAVLLPTAERHPSQLRKGGVGIK